MDAEPVTGAVTTAALLGRGGYAAVQARRFPRNDMTPPGVYLDNMPNWEYGALMQSRDLARALRELFSRSQSQSKEDVDLAVAEPRLNFQHDSWLLPATETKYRESMRYTEGYLVRLNDPGNPMRSSMPALTTCASGWRWSTRASAACRSACRRAWDRRVNTDLAGDQSATQATSAPSKSTCARRGWRSTTCSTRRAARPGP
jgi:hypothetical protein